AVALVIASMVGGAVLFQVGRSAFESPTPHADDWPTTIPGSASPSSSTTLSTEEVERVVAAHRVSLKRACWDGRNDLPPSAKVTLTVTVNPNGNVVSTTASGSDAIVANCAEDQVRAWKFPPGKRDSSVNIPLVFARD